ncbi:hypothetical protein [Salinibaculum rarum]|uniref:hypothetical protein n=1 Tax=Salinibaculum rarum TaxID=3058903 RepID=UPI0026603240|nr:hypothetical protein [Salinibaculum sp. KK48]
MSNLQKRNVTVTYSCVECDNFELGKSYTGREGTPGETEFEAITAPDECPVCGGDVETVEQ